MSQLGDALFTTTQQKVLGLLYSRPEKSFYTKEILRLTGMGVATIKRELDRMVAAGILKGVLLENEYCRWYTKETPAGPQTFYEVLGKSYQDKSSAFAMYESLQQVYDKYGERSRQSKNNEGIDWKAVSHAARAALQLKEIYTTGDLVFPLREKDLLLGIKLGKMDFVSEVSPLLDKLTQEVEELSKKSSYPKTPDRVWWEDYLVQVYQEVGI